LHTTRLPCTGDARILFQPATTYRALARIARPRAALAGQLFVAVLVLGSTVSLVASGRLSLRLIADGSLSFAFLPTFAVAGFAAVYFASRPDLTMTFTRALDLFTIGQLPWLLWLLLLATISSFVPPRQLGPWIVPLELALAVPAVWSGIIDFYFFREVLARPRRAALRDLLLYRLLAWGASTAYFFGIAIWHELVPQAIKWVSQ
jgi:hypothetical protein